MKRIIAALVGGSVAGAAAIIVVNLVLGSTLSLETAGYSLIIGLVIAVLSLLANRIVRLRVTTPSLRVGSLALTGAVLLPSIFAAVTLYQGISQSWSALAVLSGYGLAAGLGGSLLARSVSKERAPAEWSLLGVGLALVLALTGVAVFNPPAPLFGSTGNVVVGTAENFASEVEASDIPVLLDFSAKWCGPCKALVPHLNELSTKYKGKVKVVSIDVDEQPDLKERFDVHSMPTLVLMKGGKEVDRHSGFIPLDKLVKFVFGK